MSRVMWSLLLGFLVLPTITAVRADGVAAELLNQGMVVKPSTHSVSDTLDKLESIVKAKGFTVFARIDHAAGASKVGQSMRPNEVLLFGNPQIGTALMLSRASAGLDLPIRVAAWQDDAGQVWIAYNAPDWLAQRHGITDRQPIISKMSGALGNLTDAAAQ